MYSWYLLRRTGMANNNDTITDCFVLAERDDLLRVLETLDVNHGYNESCTLRVYREAQLVTTIDLFATVPDDDIEDVVPPDLSQVTIPDLDGPILPPGHPVIIDGEPLHYGCTSFYN